MKALIVDVFFPVPRAWSLCQTCETVLTEGQVVEALRTNPAEALPGEWQRDLERLDELIGQLSQARGDQILIRMQDPHAFPGMLKAIRHRVRKYPTFVIGGRERIVGFQVQQLQEAIAAAIANSCQAQEAP